MFTTEQLRRSTLHEIISHLCLEKTRHARFLRYVYAPVESSEISTPCQKLTSILIFLVGCNIRHIFWNIHRRFYLPQWGRGMWYKLRSCKTMILTIR